MSSDLRASHPGPAHRCARDGRDRITTTYAAQGKHVTIIGMNPDSAERHERLAGNLGGGH